MKTSRLFALLALPLHLVSLCAEAAAPGTPLWTNIYNGPGNYNDYANAIAVDKSGNVFVTGNSSSSTNGSDYDYLTIKYSNVGVPLWTNRYNGPANGSDVPTALAVANNGNVYVTGLSLGNDSTNDYLTIGYSNTGVPLWTNRFNGPANADDRATAIAVDSGGNVFVTGYSYTSSGSSGSADYITIKYTSTGQPLWTNRFNGAADNDDRANAILVDTGGNIYVTGYSVNSVRSNSIGDYATIKYSNAGVPLWTNFYNGPDNYLDVASAIGVDGDGNVFVTGYSSTSSGPTPPAAYATIKYSSTGAPQWTNRFARFSFNHANAIAVDGSGNVFVTGYSGGTSQYYEDYATVAYSNTGVPLWTNFYNGTGNYVDVATSIGVDSVGNVFVTGYASSTSSSEYYYATIKYSRAGLPLWTNFYNAPETYPAFARSLAVDVNGNVIVTGHLGTTNRLFDYATIKYSATSEILAWWRGESNALDSVGPNHGTLLGGATFAAGQVGQAFSFNGSSQHVLVGNPASLKLTSALTIEGWINPTDATEGALSAVLTKWSQNFQDEPASDSYGLWVIKNSGVIQLFGAIHQPGASEPHVDGGTLPAGSFSHVAMTFDAATGLLAIYVNGQVVNSATVAAAPIYATDAPVVIGGEPSSPSRYFNGLIDELSVYSRALSAAELQAIYTAGSAGKAASGTAYLWNGDASGETNWFTATNWLPAGVPGANDTVVINSGTVDLPTDTAVTSLTLATPAILQGSGTLTVSGAFNWTGGIMQGTGTTVIAPGATLAITGDYEKRLGRRLDNFGTATWSGARITGENGPVFNNQPGALFDIQTETTLYDSYGSFLGTFNNAGTLRKSTGTNATVVNGFFTSSGTVDVQTGTLSPAVSAMLTNGTFTGAGRFLINNISATLDGTATIAPGANFELAAGTLGGTNTILGAFNWTGGILEGAMTIPTNSVLLITGGVEKRLRGQLNNFGTVTWSGARITGQDSPVINNQPGALFDIQADGVNLYESYGGAPGTLNNSGLVRKSAGTNAVSIYGPFNNSGTAEVQTGVLALIAGGTSTGVFTNAPGAVLDFTGGSHGFNDGVRFDGAGLSRASGGTVSVATNATATINGVFELAANGLLDGDGSFTAASGSELRWTGGTMSGTGTTVIASNAVLTISGGSEKRLRRRLDNFGTATWSGARLTGESGPVINNQPGALFDIQADGVNLYESYGGAPGTFNNYGLVRKSAGTNAVSIYGTFNNNGVLELQRGVLAMVNSYVPGSLSSVRIFLGGTVPKIHFGQFQIDGAATLGGTLNVSLTNGFTPAASDNFTVVTFGSRSGAFFPVNGVGTGAGVPLVPAYQPTSLILTALQSTTRPAGLIAWWRAEENAYDSVSTNHGTLQNGTLFATGKVGQGFSFSGAAGERVVVTHNNSLNLESLPGTTFEGWFKSTGGDAVIVAKHDCGAGNGWFFTTAQGGYIGGHHIGGDGVGGLDLNDGQFHHFAVVKDGTNYSEYVDGVLISSDTGPATGTPTTASVQLGGITGGSCNNALQLNGVIDEVALYSRALSSNEIAAIYNAVGGKSVPPGYSYVWNGGSGVWLNTTNWTPTSVPMTNDTAIVGGGTVTVGASVTVSNLTLANATVNNSSTMNVGGTMNFESGTLTGAGATTVANQFNWSSGSLTGTGSLTLLPGGAGAISGAVNKAMLNGWTLNNQGTLAWTGAGGIDFFHGTWNNSGVLDIQNDATMVDNDTGTTVAVFNNTGTVRKTAGSGSSTFTALQFNNSGAVRAQSGIIALSSTGVSGGNFESASPGTVAFTGSSMTLTNGASLTGTGTNRLTGATLTLSGNATGARFEIAGGTLSGTGNLTLTNQFNWSSGGMSGIGSLTLLPGCNGSISGAASKPMLNGWTLNNQGTLTWTGTGGIDFFHGTWNNSGVFDVQNDATMVDNDTITTVTVFNNTGTLRKSVATGTSTFSSLAMTNSGVVEIRSGTIATPNNYTPAGAGIHRFPIGGYTAGTGFGKLQAAGGLTLAGQLDLALVNGFIPTNGAAFPIITASSRTGVFAPVTGRAIGGAVYFSPNYLAGGVTLLVADVTPRFGTNFFSQTNKQFQFRVNGTSNETYRIDVSTNLPAWTPLATNAIPGAGYFDFVDTGSTNSPRRFYRAVFLP